MFHQFCCKVSSPTPGRGATLNFLKWWYPTPISKFSKLVLRPGSGFDALNTLKMGVPPPCSKGFEESRRQGAAGEGPRFHAMRGGGTLVQGTATEVKAPRRPGGMLGARGAEGKK